MLADLIVESYQLDNSQIYQLTNKRLQKLLFCAFSELVNTEEIIKSLTNRFRWVGWREHGPVLISTYYSYSQPKDHELNTVYYLKEYDNNSGKIKNPLYKYPLITEKVYSILKLTKNLDTNQLIQNTIKNTPWQNVCQKDTTNISTINNKEISDFYKDKNNLGSLYSIGCFDADQFDK